jgi:toxin-antitoxin system PIN domain toxin
LSRPALLDLNILLALFDHEHVHHETAHDWFADHRANGWATCPLTENGFVRLVSHPASVIFDLRAADSIEYLRKFCASGHHVFWPESVSLRDTKLFNPAFIQGPRQLTDIYLLGLAKKMGGTLATFDQSIPIGAVVGASRATLSVVSSEDVEG